MTLDEVMSRNREHSILKTKVDTDNLVYGIVISHFAAYSIGIRYNQIINEAKISGYSDRTIKRSISKLEAEERIRRVVNASVKPAAVTYEPTLEYAHEIIEIMKKDHFVRRFLAISEWFESSEKKREEKVKLLNHILRNMFFLTSKWPALAVQWALKAETRKQFLNDFMIRWNGDILFRVIALAQFCWENKDIAEEALNQTLEWMDEDLERLAEEALKGKETLIDFSKIYP